MEWCFSACEFKEIRNTHRCRCNALPKGWEGKVHVRVARCFERFRLCQDGKQRLLFRRKKDKVGGNRPWL